MKRLWIILILSILLALLFAVDSGRREPASPAQEELIEQEVLKEQQVQDTTPPKSIPFVFTPPLKPATQPVAKPDTGPVYPGLPVAEDKSLFGLVTSVVDTNLLKRYEGSYSLDELGEGRGDGSVAVNIRSSWFLGSSNAPQAGLRVRLNPLTGQHEIVGGEIYLPGKGIGVSSELDEGSGEARTFLNLQKKF